MYESDIFAPAEDSLERVMGQIYTDTFNPGLEKKATEAFQALLRLFTRRIADTTNQLKPTIRRLLYRILVNYLEAHVRPEQITIITYNQDLQAEKSLCLMSEAKRWQATAGQIFNFPGCYALGKKKVTKPTNKTPSRNLFKSSDAVDGCIRVLKLHGSLNWYSSHSTQEPSPTEMFDPSRELRITQRRIIPADMTISGQQTSHALPVVVPPVTHKSAVLHDDLKDLWRLAEQALEEADEIVIFGYSCPPLDFESANQLRRASREHSARISVIDPDGQIAARYIELMSPGGLAYFSSAHAFLDARRNPAA
ncbi:MAG TPA: hypothetical protein VFW48_06830 [Solirubrobacterales bacterium]|nr:hypothetical protein [Solirubrobacterales bacterium]